MQALLGVLAALTGLLLVPVALAGGTAWMLIPGHLLLAGLCAAGSVLAGLGGRPGRARWFGGGYLLASLAMVGALGVGAELRDSWYWMIPWSVALCWGWAPPVVAGVMASVGTSRRRARTRAVVRKRRRRMAQAKEFRESS